jgi:hypothetical protein
VTDHDKLRVMLGHWIEHNDEHAAEFLRWVERAGPAAEELRAAARGIKESSRHLAEALQRLGGPLSPEADGDHGHEHRHGQGPADLPDHHYSG